MMVVVAGRCKTSSTMMMSRSGANTTTTDNVCSWENNLSSSVEYVDRQKHLIRERNRPNAIYSRLNANVSHLMATLDWTIDHIELPFTWPTQYNEAGQEHIRFDEDKVKVAVDVHSGTLEELGREQLQDIVSGWISHLKATDKALQERQPVDFTPMAEHELWRVRESQYNTLLEQLKHPFVTRTIGNIPVTIIVVVMVVVHLQINSIHPHSSFPHSCFCSSFR